MSSIRYSALFICRLSESVELTFELPDSAKECFHEVIEKDVEATVEFQVNSLIYHLIYIPRLLCNT